MFDIIFAVMLIFNSRIKKLGYRYQFGNGERYFAKIASMFAGTQGGGVCSYSFGKQIFTLSQATPSCASETYLMPAIRKEVRDDKSKTAQRVCCKKSSSIMKYREKVTSILSF